MSVPLATFSGSNAANASKMYSSFLFFLLYFKLFCKRISAASLNAAFLNLLASRPFAKPSTVLSACFVNDLEVRPPRTPPVAAEKPAV